MQDLTLDSVVICLALTLRSAARRQQRLVMPSFHARQLLTNLLYKP